MGNKTVDTFSGDKTLELEHKNDLQKPAVTPSSGSTVMGKQWVIVAQYIEAPLSKTCFVDTAWSWYLQCYMYAMNSVHLSLHFLMMVTE